MSQVECIFLDDGGVLNDNRLRGPQWQRLVGEFFVPRLGGTHEQWANANRTVIDGVFERLTARWQDWDETSDNYHQVFKEYARVWLNSMCAEVGIAELDLASQDRLAHEAAGYIEPKVQAAFAGTAEALHELSRQYVLFMASTGASWELEMRLGAMGVAKLFRRLYGPDLINVPKTGRRYYQRVFEHAAVDPGKSLVVDDKVEFLEHAAALGAHTVLVCPDATQAEHEPCISALSELPAFLQNL
jgi:HAD superfamily hydrolase (TIGR01509 family)